MKINHDKNQSIVFEKELFQAITALKSIEDVMAFFHDLCTPAELQAMADRWRVVEPIQQKIPYREIHDQTGVSVTTIGRVARCLQFGSGGYSIAYERIRQKSKPVTDCYSKKR